MGAAIPVMHYTGMAAVTFVPMDMHPVLRHAVAMSSLSTVVISTVTLIILGLTILTSFVDRRFSAQAVELQRLMEHALAARDKAEQANAALRESEAQFRSLVEGAPDAILVRSGYDLAYVNPAGCRLLGADSPGQLLGQSVVDRFHPSTREGAILRIQRMFADRLPSPMIEQTWLRLDGRAIPVDVAVVPLMYHGRQGALIFGRDVSQRKKVESALHESEVRYRNTLEAAPDAIVVVDAEANIVLVNAQTEKAFGHSRERLLGQSVSLLFPERVRLEQSVHYATYLHGIQAQMPAEIMDLLGIRSDGTEFPIEVSLSPLETEEGVLAFSSIRDITERRRTEQKSKQFEMAAVEAQSANTAKSMFLSTMSHEIRTPLNAILGFSQLMLRDPKLGADAKANLKIVNRSGEHLLNILNDILDMAKIEAGRVQLAPRNFSLRGLVRDLESLFRPACEAKGLQFAIEYGGQVMEFVTADEGRLRQMLINLVGNAIKFTAQGRIELRVALNYLAEDTLWLSAEVEDTGLGMTTEEQRNLFQPFVQTMGGQNIGHGGTGLGLAISQRVAGLMGGEITCRSQTGVGSTFCINVPVERGDGGDCQEQSRSDRRVSGIAGKKQAPRILIADDVADNREWLSRLLTVLGFSVRSAEDGQAAIDVWEEWHPELILMDIHMPVLDGLEAANRIRSRPGGKDVLIIALTADALTQHRDKIAKHQINDFVSKPCSENELLDKIGTHLGLEYVYDDEPTGDSGESRPAPAPGGVLPQGLKELAPDLLQRLHDATLRGNKTQLNQLILSVSELGKVEPARGLQELADGYRYDQLISLLEAAKQ